MAETDEDRVVGIDGLTARATRHEIELNGVSLWTWSTLSGSPPRSRPMPSE